MGLLEADKLTKGYGRGEARLEALRGVSLTLEAGELLGVVGESGSGKTTLLKLLSGLEAPDGGVLLLDGQPLTPRRTQAQRRAIQLVFQDAAASFPPRQSVLASLRDAARALLGPEEKPDYEALATSVGLDPALLRRTPRALSGGQCQRFAIARAMLARPRILLCDEITSALDLSSQALILRLVAGLCRKEGTAAVFVSHDLAAVSSLCSRLLVLKDGRQVEAGDTKALLLAPREDYTKQLIASTATLR